MNYLQNQIGLTVESLSLIQIYTNKKTFTFGNSMTSFEKIGKNSLYRSHCQLPQYRSSMDILGMNQSIISTSNEKKQKVQLKQNKIAYKYERVGNMFKLVQVEQKISNHSNKSNRTLKSNNSEDPKQQPIFQENKMNKINEAIHDLTSRIICLELQQAKIPGIQKKLNETSALFRNIQSQGNYLSEKVTGLNSQILDIKQRLQEVEQQGGGSQKKFTDFEKLINDIRQETFKTIPDVESKYEQMITQLRHQVYKQIQNLRNNLKQHSNFTNKSFDKKEKSPRKENSNIFKHTQKPLKLKYRQTYEVQDSTYCITQLIYKIDRQGRLMDSSGFVILDSSNREIRLNQTHLRKLSELGILF